jgi:uncharacterized repeat protein (TIGR02543 family)
MNKRIVSIILSFLIIVTCFPLNLVHALPQKEAFVTKSVSTISVESVYAKAGKTVDVDVKISDNCGIAGAQLTITYDAGLTLTGATSGAAFSNLDYTRPSSYSSPCNFNWDSENAMATEDGTILTLTFAVDEDVSANTYLSVNISSVYGDIYDIDTNSLSVNLKNGYIDVIDFIYGDVNNDDTINGKDVTLIRRFNAGYDVNINEAAADVNSDGRINGKDVTLIRRYNAGWDIKLPTVPPSGCNHNMEHHAAVPATCTEDGNIEYWHCTNCGKYFTDANGNHEISQASTIIHATGHSFSDEWSFDSTYHWHASTCEHETAVGDRAEHTFNADGICTVCGASSNTPDPSKPYRIDFRLVEYNTNQGDSYIATQEIDNSANEEHVFFSASETFELKPISCPGYEFLGWYTPEGVRMTSVPRGTDHDLILYARWREIVYDITYRVYMTPLGNITDERYLHYTVSKGLQDLPNPTINNYEFLGWYTDVSKKCGHCETVLPANADRCTSCNTGYIFKSGGEEVSRIPIGTTGDIVLNAYWTSFRNRAKAKANIGDPTVIIDNAEGRIYFTYELGTIENVPISDALWTMQGVSGLDQTESTTVTTSISETNAYALAETISNTTVDSNTWRLSQEWSDATHVDEGWAEEHGMTTEEAETILKGETNTYSVTSSSGGSTTNTTTNGTTVVDYNSKNTEFGAGAKYYNEDNWKVTDSTSWGINGELSIGREKKAGINAGIGAKKGDIISGTLGLASEIVKKIGLTIGGNYGKEHTNEVGGKSGSEWSINGNVNTHSGQDTTTIESHVESGTSTWNNSATSTSTQQASQSNTVSQIVSDVLSKTYNVGTSYIHVSAESSEQGFSNSNSQSVDTTSTITYSTQSTTTRTKTYSSDGKSDGWYRLVIAGRMRVFGVVGYDVASKSYFVYSYSIMEDETYDFLDYSPYSSFDDNENTAIPFNVPFDIFEYVGEMTLETEGILFRTNTTEGTATVIGYNGDDEEVHIPSFYSNGGNSYIVTGLSANAFAGKDVKAVILSEYINEIPDEAFKNCTSLESVYGRFTRIGNEAFSGCTSLTDFELSSFVSYIGVDAFKNVPQIKATVLSESSAYFNAYMMNPDAETVEELTPLALEFTANAASYILQSGANSIIMDLSLTMDGAEFTLEVPEMESFELLGGKKTFTNLKIDSNADTTIIRNANINDCTRIPLVISSDNITLDTVTVNSPSFAMLSKSPSVNMTLIRDNVLKSASGHAVVCKDPTIISEISTRATVGVLDITGNMYVCGNPPTPGSEYIDFVNGQIVYIGSDQFDQLIRGYFTVTFNPNGGSVDPTAKNVGFGEVYGELPVPTRSTYDFVGWFTEPSGGTQITADTVSTTLYNQTLYAHWELKQYTVTFDANGGNCGTLTMPAIIGMAPSSLPTATKNYHNFLGWFTEDDIAVTVANYNAVIAEMDPVELVTNGLTLYAHYELKPVSNWVLYENMPADAQIVQQKWTYTKTTTVESTNTSMPGYTLVRSYWRQTGSGNFNYASFPSGYDTNNWYYQNWNRSAYSSYENNTNKRVVNTNWAGWIYWHWMYNVGWANVTNRAISHRYGYWNSSGGTSGGFLYQYFTAIASATDCPYLDNMYCCSQNLPSYNAISIISDTTNVGTPRMFRFNYYNCSYTDYEKVFVYQKVENLESSTPVTPSSTITNVQHWVRYRDK